MQRPTANDITQKKHGQFNAVDFSYLPDDIVYAPERMTFFVYYPLAGDAGNNLQMDGPSGRHGFCHLEKIFVESGQTVERGAPIAKMGYTGLTDPVGPTGKHLHWVLLRNGIYVYPPDYVNESFIKKGGDMSKPTRDEWQLAHQLAFQGQRASEKTIDDLVSFNDLGAGLRYLYESETYKTRLKEFSDLQNKSGLTPEQQKDLAVFNALKERLK